VEASSDCSKDRLDLYDGWTPDDGKQLARLCGTDQPAETYLTDSNLAVVGFTSDESGADAGFRIEYQLQVRGADLPSSDSDGSQGKHTLDHCRQNYALIIMPDSLSPTRSSRTVEFRTAGVGGKVKSKSTRIATFD